MFYLINDFPFLRAPEQVEVGSADRDSFRKVDDVVEHEPPVQRFELICWKN